MQLDYAPRPRRSSDQREDLAMGVEVVRDLSLVLICGKGLIDSSS
jgi:hypothetical protein